MALNKLGSITVDGESVDLFLAQYANGSPAVVASVAATGEPFGKLSVNLVDEQLEEGEIAIKTYAENKAFAEAARHSGLFIDTRKRVKTGFVRVEIWRLAPAAQKSG
jgi:uncharacterized protein (DUF2141 family)